MLTLISIFVFIAFANAVDISLLLKNHANLVKTPFEKPIDVNSLQPQFFNQKLDHFGWNKETWRQKFYVNRTYYQFNGPIFFQVGGEGPISSEDVTSLQMSVYAKQFGAAQVTLEHRFYGDSRPFSNLTTDNLKYLSSEQALADAAVFIHHMRQIFPDSKGVVAFGGSYPGALAAWLRLKYPTLIDLSIATSAPVLAVEDMVSYLEVVDKTIAQISGQLCDNAIQNATQTWQKMALTAQGAQQLSSMFNTCEPMTVGSDWKQWAMFASALMGNWMGTVQYNRRRGHHIGIPTVSDLCNIMQTPRKTPLENYVDVNNLFMKRNKQTCLSVNYDEMIEELSDLTDFSGGRSWTYQTCTEFGYFQTTDGPSTAQPFGDLVPLKFYSQMCKDAFGANVGPPAVDQTNVLYGGDKPLGASKILFVNCEWDEWASLSIEKDLSPTLKALVVRDGAHCCTMDPYQPGKMSPYILQAQKQIAAQIAAWL